MGIAFLDTNALIKLYIPEIGSAWLNNYVANQQIVISQLALFETATVLRRRYLEGAMRRDIAFNLYNQITSDSKNWIIIPLGTPEQLSKVIDYAFNLTSSLRLRALDAIHLATAALAKETADKLTPPEPFVFISADAQLLRVAQAEGFVIENPETHP